MDQQYYQLECTQEKAGRLDKYLAVCLPEYSRARLQQLIQDGMVKVNGKAVLKPSFAVAAGDRVEVEVPPPQPSHLAGENIPLEILFENDDFLVINKPAGIVVHPSAGHEQGTLVNAVLAHVPELEGIGGERRPGVVHRLDKDTSGVLLMAKNDRTHRWLQEQFRRRQVRKVYLALVDGRPPTPEGRIEVAIARDAASRKKMAAVRDGEGREAVTEYYTLESFPEHTLLEVHPHTGRTHQIRVHLAFLGCPVAGDEVYGRKRSSLPMGRHFLHASRLTIQLPGETGPRTFVSPLPEELEKVLQMLRQRR